MHRARLLPTFGVDHFLKICILLSMHGRRHLEYFGIDPRWTTPADSVNMPVSLGCVQRLGWPPTVCLHGLPARGPQQKGGGKPAEAHPLPSTIRINAFRAFGQKRSSHPNPQKHCLQRRVWAAGANISRRRDWEAPGTRRGHESSCPTPKPFS